jgi:hypothetical protein
MGNRVIVHDAQWTCAQHVWMHHTDFLASCDTGVVDMAVFPSKREH